MRTLCVLVLGGVLLACTSPEQRKARILERVRNHPTAMHISVERAIEQAVAADRSEAHAGRWYCNEAIEYESGTKYKVGYRYMKDGRTVTYGFLYDEEDDRLEPITAEAKFLFP